MKAICVTKIGNDDYSIISFPLNTQKINFRGLNLTVIVLAPVEFDELTVSCNRFINLSTITCKKVSIVASTYINMGQLQSEKTPEITVRDVLHHHSFNPKEGVLKKIWQLFWDSIEEKQEEVSPDCYKEVTTVSDEGVIKGLVAVDEAVFNYSPHRSRKY